MRNRVLKAIQGLLGLLFFADVIVLLAGSLGDSTFEVAGGGSLIVIVLLITACQHFRDDDDWFSISR